ncbi:MAG TPA: hypothetical protein VJB60_05055 [Candidatus Peribacterales bacterium]|nr:hypothetical protein [Candidatus Peribacterales bacterium]
MARSSFLRVLRHLDIEEKILNLGSIVALLGIFVPWFGGDWFGDPATWSGFQFYTSFIGLLIFLGHVFILSLTVLPLMGYSLVKTSLRELLRLIVALESVLLTIVAWSVLTNISFDRSQMEIRFGIYLTLVGSIVTSLYAFLRVQQQRHRSVRELFHHPDDTIQPPEHPVERIAADLPPAPPPPSLSQNPEEFRLF